MPIKRAIAASLACFCLNASLSATIKVAQGYVDLRVAWPLCLGTLLGANLGALINRRFPSRLLKVLFGALFVYVSIKFVLAGLEVSP